MVIRRLIVLIWTSCALLGSGCYLPGGDEASSGVDPASPRPGSDPGTPNPPRALVLSPPPPVTREASGPATPVSLGIATSTGGVAPRRVSNDAPADGFPVGLSMVTWALTDAAGAMTTAAQSVIVRDTTSPNLMVPPDVMVNATGTLSSVSLGIGSATDLVAGDVAVTNDAPAAGFPVGTTSVVWTATDSFGNTATASQTVMVSAVLPDALTIAAPAPLAAEATGVLTLVPLGSPTASGGVAPRSITNDAPPAGFPVGNQTVLWTATDATAAVSQATQQVQITDTTPPTLSAPADVTAPQTGVATPAPLGSATATDLADPAPFVTNNAPPSGFPVGTSNVVWRATDASGNESTSTQRVTVTPALVGDPAAGADEYALRCSGCHGVDPATNAFNILDGVVPAAIESALTNVTSMSSVAFLLEEPQTIVDLAAYLAAVEAGEYLEDPYPGENPPIVFDNEFPAAPAGIASTRRLTSSQYRNSVEDVLGVVVAESLELPPDIKTSIFDSVGAGEASANRIDVELYEAAAVEIATDALPTAAGLPDGCNPTTTSDPCIDDAIGSLGRRLWRRPLGAAEVAKYRTIVTTAGDGDLLLGLRYALAGLLQSPNFLYITSFGELDQSGQRRFTSLEMATRLAAFVYDSTPDEALLAAAERGELVDPQALKVQLDRMRNEPRGRGLATRFFRAYLGVSTQAEDDKDATLFPEWSQVISADFDREFDHFLRDLTVTRNGDLRDLFDSNYTFANTRLVDYYGARAVDSSPGPNIFALVAQPAERAGLLTSGAFMASNALPNRTSPTKRGIFLVERVLCYEVPPPPENLDLNFEGGPSEFPTLRERMEAHASQPACASCHEAFDPVGFTLENFDSIGRYRDTENGQVIDPAAVFQSDLIDGAADLGRYIAAHPNLSSCVTEHLFTYAAGRQTDPGEAALIDFIGQRFQDSGFSFGSVVEQVVVSPAFRYFLWEN